MNNEHFNYAFKKARCMFPGLMEGKTEEGFQSKVHLLKKHLSRSIDLRLDRPENKSLLQGRENEPALCIALGMDAEMVDLRFKAIHNFEAELGIVGKAPIVYSILLLIELIEVQNPLGPLNDDIEKLGNSNHSYLRVKMEWGKMASIIECVRNKIQEKGLKDLFMHGTKAAVPIMIVTTDTEALSIGYHDFGHGLYCFQDHIIAALSFAVDRSFVDEDPTIIAFLEPDEKSIELNTVDVNHTHGRHS